MAHILRSYSELVFRQPLSTATVGGNVQPTMPVTERVSEVTQRRQQPDAPDATERSIMQSIFQENVKLRGQLQATSSRKTATR
jgi:hypothetical protein